MTEALASILNKKPTRILHLLYPAIFLAGSCLSFAAAEQSAACCLATGGDDHERSARPMTEAPSQSYTVEVKAPESFTLRTENSGDWEMAMQFAVFYSPTDPKMAMRGGNADVAYNLVSWFNEALDEESTTVEKIENFASVGDGFDPQILRGSTSFRTADLFEAAPHVSLTA